MLQTSEIHRLTYDESYRNGLRDYQEGAVENLQIEWPEEREYGNALVKGEVAGRGEMKYPAQVLVSNEDEILDFRCDCSVGELNWGMCRHCAALAHAYRNAQKMREIVSHTDPLGLRRETTKELSQLLYQYSMRNRMNQAGGVDGEIRLEFSFQPDRNEMLMDCRIGSKRMYVVKNLVKLVRDVEEMREVRYGANLCFVHDLTAFEPESRELFSLLQRAVISRFPDYQNSYYEMSSNYRYLLLKGESLEYFLEHFLGKTIRLEEQDIPVRDENPTLSVGLKETLGGAELSTEPMGVYTGSQHTYIRKEGVLWRCSRDFVENVLPVWRIIWKKQKTGRGKKALFLSREDYGSFCRNVLPAIRDFVRIDSGTLDLAAYVPPDPEYGIYMGMPEDLLVEASVQVSYGEAVYDLLADPGTTVSERDLVQEAAVRKLFGKYFEKREDITARRADGLPADASRWYAVGEEALFHLIDEGLPEMKRTAELFVDDTIRRMAVRNTPKVSMGVGIAGDLLDLTVETEGLDAEDLSGVLAGYRRKRKYYRLKNGDFLRLADDGMETLYELSEGLQLGGKELSSGHVTLPSYRALYLDGMLRDGGGIQSVRSADYRRLVRNLREYTDGDYEVPENLSTHLRRYQRDGFRWLCTLYEYGFGGILADDMGLGKTVQILAQQLHARQGGEKKSTLIVAPASLLYNWESEAGRFTPSLSVQVIAGTAEERREQIAGAEAFDLNITSYDLLKRDVKQYEEKSFDTCIIDEAQYIKNAGTQAARAVKRVRAAHRFALTGTPVENRLSDLWSIFDFLMPGYLFAYSRFREELEVPVVKDQDEAASRRLNKLVTPFLLRRKKMDVLKDLPEKLVETVYVRMTEEQERIYRAHLENIRRSVMEKDAGELARGKIEILAELTRLRQLCCTPGLIYENYGGGSGKIDACLELMKNATEAGHRILVFSQFTSLLERMEQEWSKTGETSLYLSGKDSKQHRRDMVDAFQKGEIPVFFISLKAGGTGLNLTAADIVIHLDPWWNRAAEDQATDRAHRIGQKHVVNVIKLVAKDSIEEKILKLQDKKAALADAVTEGEGVADITLDREQLMEILG